MRRLGSLIFLPAVALAAPGDSNGDSSQASLGRVQVTLQSLLRNIQDTGRHAEKALKHRHQWCEGASSSYAEKEEAMKTDVEHLRLDLLEQEAALEEAEGSLRERHAEVAMLQHTINMTASVLQDAKLNASLAAESDSSKTRDRSEAERRLTSLLESRQQTVVSLQAELSALQPRVSQLQAQVAEGRRQITDRSASSNAQAAFGQAVRDSCQASLRSTDKQAALRVAEAGAISKALQALEQLGVAPTTQSEKASTDDAALAQGLAEVSFVQLKREKGKAAAAAADTASASTESGEEQLYSLFGDDVSEPAASAAASAPPAADVSSSDSSADAEADAASPESAWGPAVNAIANAGSVSSGSDKAAASTDADDESDDDDEAVEPPAPASRKSDSRSRPLSATGSVASVEQLLSAVKTEGQAEQSRRAWCSQEKASNGQRLSLAQDAVERAGSEAQMHGDMEAQLGEVLSKLQSAQGEIGTASSAVADDASKELSAINAELKDQDLATKILQQASKFLQESQAAEQTVKQGSKQAVQAAVQELAKAKKLFQAQEKLNRDANKEMSERVSSISAAAKEAKVALEKEANGLVLARDSHASLRRRSEEEKATRQAEVEELQQYMQGLAKSCDVASADASGSTSAGDAEERQQAAEMQVLEDAQKVLKGEKLSSETRSAGGLRGGAKPQVDTSKLSPLQRAALEMGLSTDGN